jgi:hypothetical protein
VPEVISALLLDVSSSGFRAIHQSCFLKSGLEVLFQHKFASGRAVVMWSRILPQVVESGFLILNSVAEGTAATS